MNYDNLSFKQAFATARRGGVKTFKWRGKMYSTQIKQEQSAPVVLGTTGKHVDYIDKDGTVKTTQGIEYVVNAPRTRIDPRYKGTLFQLQRYLPDIEDYPDRVWQDYVTGQYFITDNYGNIIGTASSQEDADALNFSHYYGKLKRDAVRQSAKTEQSDEINKSIGRWDPRKSITQEKLDNDIRNARNQFANVVNGMVNYPNHVIMGPIAAAVRNDYSLSDWAKNLNPYNSINNQIIGLGDVFNPSSDVARWGLNLINPTSVAMTTASSAVDPGRLEITGYTKPSRTRLTVSAPRTQYRSGIKGAAKGSPVRNPNQTMGYRLYSHPAATFDNKAGGVEAVNITWGPEPLYAFTNPMVDINPTPTFYYRSPIIPTELRPLPQPYQAYIESMPISAHQKQWVTTGEVPEFKGLTYTIPMVLSSRPSEYMHTNLVWRGLEGNGGRQKSASYGNTNYEPSGYNVQFL